MIEGEALDTCCIISGPVTSALVDCGNADWATSPREDPLGSCFSEGLIVGWSLELQRSPLPEDPPAYVRSDRTHKKPEVESPSLGMNVDGQATNWQASSGHSEASASGRAGHPKANAPIWRRGGTFGRSGTGQNGLRSTGASHLASGPTD